MIRAERAYREDTRDMLEVMDIADQRVRDIMIRSPDDCLKRNQTLDECLDIYHRVRPRVFR